jgi:hypothetical protein
MSTISTALTTPVTIGSASYPSPLTITGTGSVKPAGTSGAYGVYSDIFTPAVLTNSGVIQGGEGDSGFGGGIAVDLNNYANVTNNATIIGGRSDFTGGTNDAGGTGVSLKNGGSTTTLTNYDNIAGG